MTLYFPPPGRVTHTRIAKRLPWLVLYATLTMVTGVLLAQQPAAVAEKAEDRRLSPPLSYASDPRQLHERIILVVPIGGSGVPSDPIRPLVAPKSIAGFRADGSRQEGLLGWSWVPTDDGKMAIVELVAKDVSEFAPLKQAALGLTGAKVFERGKVDVRSMLQELTALRKGFDITRFGTVVP